MAKIFSLSNGTVRLDTTNLDNIQRQLKKNFVVRVGVLGKKNARPSKSGPLQNADLGMIHEFGSVSAGIPARSWLRMPLTFMMPKVFQEVGQKLIDSATTKNVVTVYKSLGARAEAVIQKGFASRGFGNWAPNKPSTIRRKKSDMPLIDTAEFRKSVTSDVVSKS